MSDYCMTMVNIPQYWFLSLPFFPGDGANHDAFVSPEPTAR
jgi:hypothetical protein